MIAAYFDNWTLRRQGAASDVVFPRHEANAAVALTHLRLGTSDPSEVVRAVTGREIERHALAGEREPTVTNMAGWILAEALSTGLTGVSAATLIDTALDEGREEAAVRGSLGICWRLLLLTSLDHLRPEDASAREEERLRMADRTGRAARVGDDALEQRARSLGGAGKLAFAFALAGERTGDDELMQFARRLVTRAFGMHCGAIGAGDDGPLPRTAHLAPLLLAAGQAGEREICGALRAHLLESRVHPEKGILVAGPGEEAFEASPWVPLALAWTEPDTRPLADLFEPVAPPPPAYVLRSVTGGGTGLEVTFDLDGATWSRTYAETDLNLLVAQLLEQFRALSPGDLSARLIGHAAIGLLELAERCEGATRDAVHAVVAHGLDLVLDAQEDNGGWAFARGNVPTIVYKAGKPVETTFPDHQYTIDCAVPGIALCLAWHQTGEARYQEAADRALAFLEHEVGRVSWEGRRIWLLYPGDDKTPRMGTAVNYELWVGLFLALMTTLPASDERRRTLHGYLDDILEYTAGHLRESGDIAYGDYVGELRTPYASWDAYLLARIARHATMPQAAEMAERIVGRLAELVLPCGAVPNVVDFEEEIRGHHRWLVHRHGIGPYPLRGYYQLYFVAAGATVAAGHEGALRALAFVLLEMVKPLFGGMSTGYFADGRYDDRPDSLERIGRDWLLLALAGLPALGGLDYRPSIERVDPPRARLDHAIAELEQVATRLQDREPEPDGAAEDLRCREDGLTNVALAETAGANPSAAEALRRALDGAWTTYFNPAHGAGYAVAGSRTPMRAGTLAIHARAFVAGGTALGDPELLRRGWMALRYLFHTYQHPTGGFMTVRADPRPSRSATAEVLDAVIAIRRAMPDIAGTAGAADDAVGTGARA